MAGAHDGRKLADELLAFVDVLIPGDDVFPSAGVAGVQGKFSDRLDRLAGPDAHLALVEALAGCGGPLCDRTPYERPDVARLVEAGHPDLFAAAMKAVYLAYYESTAVHAAIRLLGHPYNTRLLPHGYEVSPFDVATDLPRHDRGHYLASADIRRVDLGGLDLPRPGAISDGG